ncbi:MAG: DUF371 domain-containing protein [Halobacteriaceae archaeon]
MEERFQAQGHEHVAATHASTLEVTTDEFLTPAGDCIVGVGADRAPSEVSAAFKAACQDATATITLTLSAAGIEDSVQGRGDPGLTFESDRSLVARTSTYIDDRTVLVDADGAAADLDRALITALADGASLEATLTVE